MQHRITLSTNLLIAVKDRTAKRNCSKCRDNANQRCRSAVVIKMAVAERNAIRQNEITHLMA